MQASLSPVPQKSNFVLVILGTWIKLPKVHVGQGLGAEGASASAHRAHRDAAPMESARGHVPSLACAAREGGWWPWAAGGHLGRLPPQASRLDVCCCLRAQELPAPSQREGYLLRFFRKVYAPFLLHRVTRVVVVSGAGGQLVLTPGRGRAGAAQPDPHLTVAGRGELTQVRVWKPRWGGGGGRGDSGSAGMPLRAASQTQVGRAGACAR